MEGAFATAGAGLGLRVGDALRVGASSSTPSDMLLAAGREGWVGWRGGRPIEVVCGGARASAAAAAMASLLPDNERHMGLLSSSGTVSRGVAGVKLVAPWSEPPADCWCIGLGEPLLSGGLPDPCFFFFLRLRTVLVAVLMLDEVGDGLLYIVWGERNNTVDLVYIIAAMRCVSEMMMLMFLVAFFIIIDFPMFPRPSLPTMSTDTEEADWASIGVLFDILACVLPSSS